MNHKKGILTLASMILSISLMCGVQVVKAADGDLNAEGGISLKDTNSNGKIDEVHITVDYAVATADAISHATDEAATISKFTVTDAGTDSPVTVGSIAFVNDSGDGEIAIFKLVLDESDTDLSVDTSGTALDVSYDATDSDLKITDGSTPVSVATIASDVTEKDGAAPIAVSSAYKDIDLNGTVDRIDVTYSEDIESSTFTASEWSFSANPHALVISSGTFLATDVLVVVADAPVDSTILDDTTVKYTAGTGITDGTNPAVTSAELSIGDKAQPIILTAVDQIGTSLDAGVDIPLDANIIITFSEPMNTSTLDANDEWSISIDLGSWLEPSWSSDGKTLTLQHDVDVDFILGETETVTLTAPLAVSGIIVEDKELQNSPADSAVNNPFTFTIADGTDEDEDEDYIPVPGYGTKKSTQPNPNSGVTLYRVGNDPRVYVIKNKKKHWIKTPKEFTDNNYNWSAVQEISAEVLEEYPDEEIIETELLRAVGSHKVYRIENGKKRWIKTAGEFNAAGYKWKDIKDISSEDLASYQNEVLSELLRAVGDYKVYKLKGGKKHWIRTAEEFNAAGYNWENVEEVAAEDLDDYPDSDSETLQ